MLQKTKFRTVAKGVMWFVITQRIFRKSSCRRPERLCWDTIICPRLCLACRLLFLRSQAQQYLHASVAKNVMHQRFPSLSSARINLITDARLRCSRRALVPGCPILSINLKQTFQANGFYDGLPNPCQILSVSSAQVH